jgi:hypothetical protein
MTPMIAMLSLPQHNPNVVMLKASFSLKKRSLRDDSLILGYHGKTQVLSCCPEGMPLA